MADANSFGKSSCSRRVVYSRNCINGLLGSKSGPRISVTVGRRSNEVSPIFHSVLRLSFLVRKLKYSTLWQPDFCCCCYSSFYHTRMCKNHLSASILDLMNHFCNTRKQYPSQTFTYNSPGIVYRGFAPLKALPAPTIPRYATGTKI